MSFEHSLVEREGPITIVTLNRPDVLNALHHDAHIELTAIFDDFAADPAQHIAILTGAGERAFCAGNDLKVKPHPEWYKKKLVPDTGFGGLTSRYDLNKPVIAAVNGLAMGGGFELALACDIIVAAEHARFGLPEPRVGLAALAGGPVRLARAIGEKRAMEISLSCRQVPAEEARALGFVSEVTPSGEVLAAARRMAELISKSSPRSIRATKEGLGRGFDMDVKDAIERVWSFPAMQDLFASDDINEGPQAFIEKRDPVWKN